MKKSKHRVLLRGDGSSAVGIGHIMRLRGLFEILSNNFNCILLINKPDDKIKLIIESFINIIYLNSKNLSEEISELDSILERDDIVVLDGYSFIESYQLYVKSKVHKLVMFDDIASLHFYADIIINHAGILLKNKYILKSEPFTKLLLGPDYLVLRKEFLRVASKKRSISKIDSIFICMGGADPFNITIKALESSLKCDFIKEIIVVIGNSFNNLTELDRLISSGTKEKKIFFERNVNARRLVRLIYKCQLAICPASSIALEACCVKIGLLTGIVVDNQESIHNHLLDSGCCLSINDFNKTSSEIISLYLEKMNNLEVVNKIMTNQLKIIDGQSDKRILEEFKMLCT